MKVKKFLAGCLLALSTGALAVGASACDFSFLSSVQFENWEKKSSIEKNKKEEKKGKSERTK